MSEDIRTLLTSRPRAKVNRRETTLTPNLSNDSLEVEPTTIKETPSELVESAPVKTLSSVEPPLTEKQQLERELKNFPPMGKRLAIHLEQDVRNELLRLCDEQEITPETFMEASFALVKEKPKIINQIVKDAKQRLKRRKRAGLLRRTLSLMDKLKKSFFQFIH